MQATTGTSLSDDQPTSAEPNPPRTFRLWAAAAVVVYVLDQVTKWWAEQALTPGVPRPLLGGLLQLTLTKNPGAAFSFATGYTVLLTAVALVVIVVCVRMARRLRSRGWALALGLIAGGALGNVTDRLLRAPGPLRGHVVDFLQLPHWPVFNLADTAISVAAVLFVVLSFRGIRLDGTRLAEREDRKTEDGA